VSVYLQAPITTKRFLIPALDRSEQIRRETRKRLHLHLPLVIEILRCMWKRSRWCSLQYIPNKIYSNVTQKEYPEVSTAVANQRCEALMKDYKIDSIDRSFYINACTSDYALSGNVGCVETYRKTYNSACGTVLDFKAQSPYTEERVAAVKAEKSANLGYECKTDQCGANGECSGNGCTCADGYLGNACEFSENEPEQIQSSSSVKIVASIFSVVIFALVA
jgi:hypothetical protein